MSTTTDMEGNRIAKGSLKQLFKTDPEFLIRHVFSAYGGFKENQQEA